MAYLVVDYGFFYALLGTRTVVGMSVLPLEIWLSFSYGITEQSDDEGSTAPCSRQYAEESQ
jgi:hypothetical protein